MSTHSTESIGVEMVETELQTKGETAKFNAENASDSALNFLALITEIIVTIILEEQ